MIETLPFSRFDLPSLLNKRGLVGFGAEIGVHEGRFSRGLLERWSGKKLYMIDSWRHLEYWNDAFNGSRSNHRDNFTVAFEHVYDFGERACIIRELSVDAAEIFPSVYFDFVYIDANHSYEAIKSDFKAWLPKVKKGGIIAGDDYSNEEILKQKPDCQRFSSDCEGVGRFIDELAETKQIFITTEKQADRLPSWVLFL